MQFQAGCYDVQRVMIFSFTVNVSASLTQIVLVFVLHVVISPSLVSVL